MTFLRQILLGNCSCRSAVAGTLSAGLASDLSAGAAGDVASRANDEWLSKPEGRRAYRRRDFRAANSLFLIPIRFIVAENIAQAGRESLEYHAN